MTKDALIDKLNERLKLANAEDAAKEKAHKIEESAALKSFRDKLREALKWDWDKVKKIGRYGGDSLAPKGPTCPTRSAVRIEAVLRMIRFGTSKTFAIKSGSDVYDAIMWVPESERVGKTVCD